MTKPLFTLALSVKAERTELFFESYDTLLATQAAFREAAIPGLTMGEDTTTRHAFDKPAAAVAHIRLWAAAHDGAKAGPVVIPAPKTMATDTGMTRKEEALALLKRPEGVSADELMSMFGILRDSATALVSTTCAKFGYTSHLKDGRYTVTKGRAEAKAAKAAKSKAMPPVKHVLGRGRRMDNHAG